ncbi:hypothetical protein CQW23_07560 [Capsicum baccatum]|uniref:Ubiquitin-like protease family profile domain-containing protein n=1 Tax=Capsicum baccatum TaxID=33114 RepID=A0A2G2X6H9_CAPBA|nr:hypothetical protein CQW23_07560 [Capsicum baccatum]
MPNRIVEKYFNGAKFIQKRQLFLTFTEKVWGESDEDAEKFAILYFLHSFVLSNVNTVVVPRLHFDLVDSGRYKDFPWGTLSFEDLARSLNNRLKAGKIFYLIQEMPLAIQVWLYECCSNISQKNASKVVFKNIERTERELTKFQILEKDVLEDERSVDSDDDFQDPPQKKINEQFADKEVKQSNVDDISFDRSGQHFNPNVVQTLNNMFDGCAELNLDKTSVEIDSQYLIPNELLRSINLNYIHSEKLVQHDGRISDEKMDETNLSDSQFTIPDEMLSSLNVYRRESITTHPPATREEEPTDEHLNDKNLSLLLKIIVKSVHDVYSMDDPNITTGGQEAHLNEYINGFRMYTVVPWHTVEDIYIPVNIKEKHHWVRAVLSFSKRCIFLYDSYKSSGHYPAILAEIKKLAEIIPLCLQACDFYDNKGIDLQNHPIYKDKDSSDLFDVLFEDNLPQQLSGTLDCGLYIVTYAECLSYGHKVLSIEFDPNTFRTRYVALLWDYDI